VSRSVLVAAIGNEYRRDDGVGPAVLTLVSEETGGEAEVAQFGDPLDLIGQWDGAELAVIIDAVASGGPPGTVSVVQVAWDDLALPPPASSHAIGLVRSLKLARAMGRVPRQLVVVAVEGADFGDGRGLSPDVARAVPVASRRVIELLESHRCV
jgi:hydrogenase maturation protease